MVDVEFCLKEQQKKAVRQLYERKDLVSVLPTAGVSEKVSSFSCYGFVHVQFGGETGIYVGHLIGQVFHCLRLSGECYRQFQSCSLFVVYFFKKGK